MRAVDLECVEDPEQGLCRSRTSPGGSPPSPSTRQGTARAPRWTGRSPSATALLAIVIDPQIADEEIDGLIRGEKIGWDRLRAAIAQAEPRLPRDHGHLAALDSSYNYLRQFTPAVLSATAMPTSSPSPPSAEAATVAAGSGPLSVSTVGNRYIDI